LACGLARESDASVSGMTLIRRVALTAGSAVGGNPLESSKASATTFLPHASSTGRSVDTALTDYRASFEPAGLDFRIIP
jgi:hypothetical protein